MMEINQSTSDCFTAQTIPQLGPNGHYSVNSDVGGIAVAFSNLVINICLPILLCWSSSDSAIQTTVLILLSQVYPILIATIASIKSNNLSLFDAHYAVAVSASPLGAYFTYSAARDLIRTPNTLFKKLKAGKKIIRFLGLLLPLLWLTVNLITFFDHQAFSNSPSCSRVTFLQWLFFQVNSNFFGVLDIMGRRDLWDDLERRGGLGTLSLAAGQIWAVYLVRHRWDIYQEILDRKQDQVGHSFSMKSFLFVYNVPAASWHVITTSHPWMIFVIVIGLWSWVLSIVKGMVFESYQFSYGQITSLFTTLPPLFSVLQVLISRRHELARFLRKLPRAFVVGLQFLITGAPNPWGGPKDQHDILFNPPLPVESTGSWVAVCCIWVIATVADVMWIRAYVRGGSIPNPRTPVTDPHDGWKPFSVTLYIFGYGVCCANILFWTSYYDRQKPTTNRKWPYAMVIKLVNILLIPVAFIMSVGPLFAPPAALSLAQQWQWTHYCDSFQGEVVLVGSSSSPSASFYFPSTVDRGALQLSSIFLLSLNESDVFHFYQPPTAQEISGPRSSITQATYNTTEQTFNVECTNSTPTNPSSAAALCGYGNYSTTPYLNFSIQSTNPEGIIRMQAKDKGWRYSDDAPSLSLHYLNAQADGSMKLGNTVLQTAVTRRNNCETLKICLAESRTPDLAILVPLGLILQTQSIFAQACTQPRVYIM